MASRGQAYPLQGHTAGREDLGEDEQGLSFPSLVWVRGGGVGGSFGQEEDGPGTRLVLFRVSPLGSAWFPGSWAP